MNTDQSECIRQKARFIKYFKNLLAIFLVYVCLLKDTFYWYLE